MNYIKYILLGIIAAAFISCGLNKEIDINLPEYEIQPVVECYLIPGENYKLGLTKSNSYFDEFPQGDSLLAFLDRIQIKNAIITIQHNGNIITLDNNVFYDAENNKLYNYYATDTVPYDTINPFTLDITLENGTKITGTARILPKVPIDSVVIEYNKDSLKARSLTYITDPKNGNANYYRRIINYDDLDSIPEQDFITDNSIISSNQIVFGTTYNIGRGTTIFNTIYRIEKQYFDYYNSVSGSIQANVNPFSQPGLIQSSVSGNANPLGIFTGMSYDRVTSYVP